MNFEKKIEKLKEFKNESAFRLFLLDLLGKMGFKELCETHKYGTPEFGKDIIGAIEHKIEGIEYYAFVVKKGNIQGNSAQIEEIKRQIKQSFEYPYQDIYGNNIKINKVRIITNEKITSGAVQSIQNSPDLKLYNNFYFQWNEGLIEDIDKYYPDYWEGKDKIDSEGFEKFVNILLHEIRSPLHQILSLNSYIANILEKDFDKKDIFSSINEINKIIIQLQFSVSSYEFLILDSQFKQSKRIINLRETINSIIEVFRESAFIEKEIIIKSIIPNISLSIDKYSFQQVLVNLISNAIKYSNNSSEIEFSYKVASNNNGHIINITNWGDGILENEKDLIFEKYYRSENSKYYNPSGSGLGLYVCKKIIESFSGSIHISRLKNPTIVTIYLPNS